MYLWNRPGISRDKFVQRPFANHLWLPGAWLSMLNLESFPDWASWKGAQQEVETACRGWIRDWQNLQDKHLESLSYLPFFFTCVSTGHLPLWGWVPCWEADPGLKCVLHQLCWHDTSCLNPLRHLRTHELGYPHLLDKAFVIFKWYLNDAYIWVICPS